MHSGITEQCLREYILALAAEGRSAATLSKYARDAATFVKYLRGRCACRGRRSVRRNVS